MIVLNQAMAIGYAGGFMKRKQDSKKALCESKEL